MFGIDSPRCDATTSNAATQPWHFRLSRSFEKDFSLFRTPEKDFSLSRTSEKDRRRRCPFGFEEEESSSSSSSSAVANVGGEGHLSREKEPLWGEGKVRQGGEKDHR